MSVDLRCPNCGDNLGKDKENTCDAWCGTCGHGFFNHAGYIESEEHYKQVQKKYPGRKIPKPGEENINY